MAGIKWSFKEKLKVICACICFDCGYILNVTCPVNEDTPICRLSCLVLSVSEICYCSVERLCTTKWIL